MAFHAVAKSHGLQHSLVNEARRMRPLRRKRQYEVTHDPVSGQERILESSDEDHLLGDEGSVDSLAKRNRYPYPESRRPRMCGLS